MHTYILQKEVINKHVLKDQSFRYDASSIPTHFQHWSQGVGIGCAIYGSILKFAQKDHTLTWTIKSNSTNELLVYCSPHEAISLSNDPYLVGMGFMKKQYDGLVSALMTKQQHLRAQGFPVLLRSGQTLEVTSENSLNPNLDNLAMTILNAFCVNNRGASNILDCYHPLYR